MQKKLLTDSKKFVYMELVECTTVLAGWQNGYAEDCKSLNIGSIPVPASTLLFRLSSAVEQSAVNRLVAGSIPAVGAKIKKHSFLECFFCCLRFFDNISICCYVIFINWLGFIDIIIFSEIAFFYRD